MPRTIRVGTRRARPDELLSVTDHLDELRRRLIVSVVVLLVAFAGMYAVHDALIDVLTWPLPDDTGRLVTLSPTEPFFTTLKVVFWASILVSLPIWLYQAYAFVIPAVAEQPRRVVLSVVAGLSGLFAAGVAFGYWVVLPVALEFLTGFGGDTFNTQLRAGEYFGFATTMLLASGLLFEVPVAMAALSRMGVTTAAMYRTHWRVALVAIAAIAAILPGGDPISMVLLMLPQFVLYAVGIVLAAKFGQAPLWRRDEGAEAA
ncbi:MAG: twin-arginine translocase subunit TatC [Thermoleophilia bacterium]